MAEGRKKAAAIRYDPEQHHAPVIVASGEGKQAERILELAKEHNIPLQQDATLIETLIKLDVGKEIPPELYQVVAEVLVFIRKMNEKARDSIDQKIKIARENYKYDES